MSDLKTRGVKALFWDFAGKLMVHGVGFVLTILLARLLQPADFGLIAMVMVYVGIAMVFTDVGLSGALIQREGAGQVHYTSVFYFNLLVGIVLSVIAYLSSDWVGRFYGSVSLVPVAQSMSLLFALGASSTVQTVKLKKALNYSALTRARVMSSVISGIAAVTLALQGAGVYSLVAQALLASALYSLFVWQASSWAPTVEFSLAALRQLWGFGFRMFLVALINAVSMRLDVLVVGKLFPVMTLGYFDLAKRLSSLVNQYSAGSLMSVMFPVLSEIQADRDRFNRVVYETLRVLSVLVFGIAGVFYLASEPLVVLLFSEKWLPAVDYIKLLMLSGFVYPLNALLVNVLSSKGKSGAFLRMAIVKKTVFFSNFLVAFQWGIEGYLIGLIIVGIINTAITASFASREMSVDMASLLMPIGIQAGIFVLALPAAVYVSQGVDYGIVPNSLAGLAMFIVLFLLINTVLGTASWSSLRRQLVAACRQVLG